MQPQRDGIIAQLVEQRTENPCVAGSIPADTTIKKSLFSNENGLFCFWEYFALEIAKSIGSVKQEPNLYTSMSEVLHRGSKIRQIDCKVYGSSHTAGL